MLPGTWLVPVTFKTENGTSQCATEILFQNQAQATITVPSACAINSTFWFKANADSMGFYRANYAAENWWRLVDAPNVAQALLSTADRAQLLDDAFALMNEGLQPTVSSSNVERANHT